MTGISIILAAINMAYGNCTTNGTEFSYAPARINHRDMTMLTSNDYAKANWWPVTDVKPPCETNEYASPIGWTKHQVECTREEIEWKPTIPPQTNEWGEVILVPVTNIIHYTGYWIERNYEVLPIPPPPPRRIYKYDLSTACIEYGEITNLITLISADVGTKWMWDAAEILVEDDPWFVAATNMVIQEEIISEEKVRKILDRAYELGEIAALEAK